MTRPLRRQIHDIGRRRAWVIWSVALAVYTVAVFHRTSLGVAGLVAAERFDISASQLATFTVVQLIVYAGMQIPVGVLLDRFGSRLLLIIGLSLMTVGQLWFAFAHSFEMGLAARVLLGIGDAMIFTSMLRLVALWFHVNQAPVITQVRGLVGLLGAGAAATPLAVALDRWGWDRTFSIAAGAGSVLLIGLVVVVKDSPYTGEAVEKIKMRALRRTLAEVWGNPGTRLGVWIHFTGQFGATVFTLLWGYPFLVEGQGLSPGVAGGLLITLTLASMVAGPIIGSLTGRLPYRRSQIVLCIVATIVIAWSTVLAWPGRAPLPVLVLLVCALAFGGPGSMVGFDLARSFHPSDRLGRATGVINIGGFFASLVTMALIGLILDQRAPGGPGTYTLTDFKVAMSVQFLLWGLGAVQIWRYRHKGLDYIDEHPGALDALRGGDTLLPGISRDPD